MSGDDSGSEDSVSTRGVNDIGSLFDDLNESDNTTDGRLSLGAGPLPYRDYTTSGSDLDDVPDLE